MKKCVRICVYAISALFLMSGSNYAMIGSLRSAGRSLMPQLSRSVLSKTRSLPTRTMTTQPLTTLRSSMPSRFQTPRTQQLITPSMRLSPSSIFPQRYRAISAIPQLSSPFSDRFRSTTSIGIPAHWNTLLGKKHYYQMELPLTQLSVEEKEKIHDNLNQLKTKNVTDKDPREFLEILKKLQKEQIQNQNTIKALKALKGIIPSILFKPAFYLGAVTGGLTNPFAAYLMAPLLIEGIPGTTIRQSIHRLPAVSKYFTDRIKNNQFGSIDSINSILEEEEEIQILREQAIENIQHLIKQKENDERMQQEHEENQKSYKEIYKSYKKRLEQQREELQEEFEQGRKKLHKQQREEFQKKLEQHEPGFLKGAFGRFFGHDFKKEEDIRLKKEAERIRQQHEEEQRSYKEAYKKRKAKFEKKHHNQQEENERSQKKRQEDFEEKQEEYQEEIEREHKQRQKEFEKEKEEKIAREKTDRMFGSFFGHGDFEYEHDHSQHGPTQSETQSPEENIRILEFSENTSLYDLTQADVKRQFRTLAHKYHPDTSTLPKKQAEEEFRKLRSAYGQLMEEVKK